MHLQQLDLGELKTKKTTTIKSQGIGPVPPISIGPQMMLTPPEALSYTTTLQPIARQMDESAASLKGKRSRVKAKEDPQDLTADSTTSSRGSVLDLWFCGWCGKGPMRIGWNMHCIFCYKPKDGHATLASSKA